jgi:hypothetical protein
MLIFCSLLLSWLHALRLAVLRLLVLLLLCHLPHLRSFLLLLMVRVVVFTVIAMDMWRHSVIERRTLRRLKLIVLHRALVVLVLEDLRGVMLVQRQEILMLLHRLAASTSSKVAGSLTQPSVPTDSVTASQSSTLGQPSAPSTGTNPWYLDSGASFHMTPHSTHLSALHPSCCHCTIHTVDGSPLSVAEQGMLCSDSFHVPDISLVSDLTMQLMSAGQITDHDYHVILDPDFFLYSGSSYGSSDWYWPSTP